MYQSIGLRLEVSYLLHHSLNDSRSFPLTWIASPRFPVLFLFNELSMDVIVGIGSFTGQAGYHGFLYCLKSWS
jgi:hypothetical protein